MGEPRNLIIELAHTEKLYSTAMSVAAGEKMDTSHLPKLPGLDLDSSFGAVSVPKQVAEAESENPFEVSPRFSLDLTPEASTYLVRGVADEAAVERLVSSVAATTAVRGVFSDPTIEVCLTCPGSAPVGTDADVARRLCVPNLERKRMNGAGVLVAIVDTGFNLAYLRAHGKNPNFDAVRSWVPRPGLTPGDLPVNHGTMCAYDVLIAAPRCTLLDIALLLSNRQGGSIMDGLLSDAVLAYSHLLRVMAAPRRPGELRSLVVNNSWGMFNPSWDFPVGHSGNYSDNANHPFNRIVGSLERVGADILFAAGNCGRECPDGRCQGVTNAGIYGANSHPQVICVAGVDITKTRVGYSTSGPGRLLRMKPDLCGYTHFRGSGVYAADGGTSAATPVVAGVVAAFRSRFPYIPTNPRTSPAALRTILTSTAEDRGAIGFDFDYGWGIVNPCRLAGLRSLTVLEPVAEPEGELPEEPTKEDCQCQDGAGATGTDC